MHHVDVLVVDDCSIDCVLLHMDMAVDDDRAAQDDADVLPHNDVADNIAHSPHDADNIVVDNYDDDDVHVVDTDDPNWEEEVGEDQHHQHEHQHHHHHSPTRTPPMKFHSLQ